MVRNPRSLAAAFAIVGIPTSRHTNLYGLSSFLPPGFLASFAPAPVQALELEILGTPHTICVANEVLLHHVLVQIALLGLRSALPGHRYCVGFTAASAIVGISTYFCTNLYGNRSASLISPLASGLTCMDRMYAVTAYDQVPGMTSGRPLFVVGRLLRCAREHLAGDERYAHCHIARPSVLNNTSSI